MTFCTWRKVYAVSWRKVDLKIEQQPRTLQNRNRNVYCLMFDSFKHSKHLEPQTIIPLVNTRETPTHHNAQDSKVKKWRVSTPDSRWIRVESFALAIMFDHVMQVITSDVPFLTCKTYVGLRQSGRMHIICWKSCKRVLHRPQPVNSNNNWQRSRNASTRRPDLHPHFA